jgi:hypothetical protein
MNTPFNRKPPIPCGSELARESGVSANINFEWKNVIASKLAPTGVHRRSGNGWWV